ncbi:flagellar basal-body rod protein FlgF [Rhizobium sp. KVB221]|uniref:Flagellar basal-body rod protein FlgF n=1 Tax=Rhizobium setariae TaxID=2801340 RepID=A0A937CKN8_9HYPH|nr:flagellar basal-body rod protein FlgF [Rhizobium setariae]MBL0370671.1 flagellar basal-body rod protein FlgF [Rhizobium setariae]
MQSGLYVALSSQISLEKRLTTIADNLANMNTVGFRATQMKFEDVPVRADGAKVNYVSEGEQYLSSANGAMVQTKNPLDFAAKGNTWFSIDTPSGNAITKDGRFSMLETGALVTLEGYPVLDAGGSAIQLNPQEGPPTASADGILYQADKPVATLGLFEVDVGPNFTRVGNSAIIPNETPQPVTDRIDAGVVQGFVEQANVNPIQQMTQMMTISRAFEQVTQLMRDSETSMGDAIKTLGGAR